MNTSESKSSPKQNISKNRYNYQAERSPQPHNQRQEISVDGNHQKGGNRRHKRKKSSRYPKDRGYSSSSNHQNHRSKSNRNRNSNRPHQDKKLQFPNIDESEKLSTKQLERLARKVNLKIVLLDKFFYPLPFIKNQESTVFIGVDDLEFKIKIETDLLDQKLSGILEIDNQVIHKYKRFLRRGFYTGVRLSSSKVAAFKFLKSKPAEFMDEDPLSNTRGIIKYTLLPTVVRYKDEFRIGSKNDREKKAPKLYQVKKNEGKMENRSLTVAIGSQFENKIDMDVIARKNFDHKTGKYIDTLVNTEQVICKAQITFSNLKNMILTKSINFHDKIFLQKMPPLFYVRNKWLVLEVMKGVLKLWFEGSFISIDVLGSSLREITHIQDFNELLLGDSFYKFIENFCVKKGKIQIKKLEGNKFKSEMMVKYDGPLESGFNLANYLGYQGVYTIISENYSNAVEIPKDKINQKSGHRNDRRGGKRCRKIGIPYKLLPFDSRPIQESGREEQTKNRPKNYSHKSKEQQQQQYNVNRNRNRNPRDPQNGGNRAQNNRGRHIAVEITDSSDESIYYSGDSDDMLGDGGVDLNKLQKLMNVTKNNDENIKVESGEDEVLDLYNESTSSYKGSDDKEKSNYFTSRRQKQPHKKFKKSATKKSLKKSKYLKKRVSKTNPHPHVQKSNPKNTHQKIESDVESEISDGSILNDKMDQSMIKKDKFFRKRDKEQKNQQRYLKDLDDPLNMGEGQSPMDLNEINGLNGKLVLNQSDVNSKNSTGMYLGKRSMKMLEREGY